MKFHFGSFHAFYQLAFFASWITPRWISAAAHRQHHSFAKCVPFFRPPMNYLRKCVTACDAANGKRNGRNFSDAIKNEENMARTIQRDSMQATKNLKNVWLRSVSGGDASQSRNIERNASRY